MAYLYNRFAKGVENNASGVQMTWWKTNFNMPVPDIWGDNSNWIEGSGPFIYHGQATSFDLTGFRNGWEALVGISGVNRSNGEGSGATHLFKQTWRDTSGSVMFTNSDNILIEPTIVGEWREWQIGSNQGIAPWEIDQNGTYTLDVEISGPDINISQTYSYTITNHPGFTGYKDAGFIWVEGDNLHYIDANGFEGSINGIQLDYRGQSNSGFIWTNDSVNSPYMYYIDDQGYQRLHPWNLEQFPSTWSNGSTSSVSGADPGYIWMDNEFGFTHIAHIGGDGKKYLIGDGNYPYNDPA